MSLPPSNITGTAKQKALEWQVILWSGAVTDEEWSSFSSWLKAESENQQAWDWLQQVNKPLNQVPERIASNVLRQDSPSISRRKMLAGLGLMSGFAVIGYGVQKTERWHTVIADLTTRKGEQRSITLPDGTLITLNTDSAVDVNFTDTKRRLRLYRGEIMVVTAKDSFATPRPFVIETRAGQIFPIGTRFSVRQLDEKHYQTQVSVFEGAVEVHSQAGIVRQIKVGEQTSFSPTTFNLLMPVEAQSSAWAQGKLIVERQTLGDFINELSRYRHGVLRCDPSVADLVVSGVYLLDNTDAILHSLQQGLPIQIRSFTRYWITLSSPS